MKRTVVINIPAQEDLKARIRNAAPEMDFQFINTQEANDMLREAEIIFGIFPPRALRGCKNLKWLQLVSSGADAILNSDVLDPAVTLTSATGAYGDIMAEFMMAQVLTLCYKLHAYRDLQRAHQWEDLGHPHMIMGKTALILGLGDIGAAVAKRLHAFGAYTIGVRRSKKIRPDWLDEVHLSEEPGLDALFARADLVAMCMPGTDQTKQMLSSARIAMLKQDAIVVNIGRGSAIDEPALVEALRQKCILGAALDVFAAEPLPRSSPLWDFDNVLITPHIAGPDFAPSVLEKTVNLFLRNLALYRAGEPLENVVDKERQYCVDREYRA